MVGEMFPDQLQMNLQRQRVAQLAQQQQTAIQNVNAARAEAERHAARGSYVTTPTPSGQTIVRQNQIGYSAPTVSYRGITPNYGSPMQRAMSPSILTPPGVNIPLFQSASRPFGSSNPNRRII